MYTIGVDIGTTTLSFVVIDQNNHILESATIQNDSIIMSSYTWEHMQSPERILELVEKELLVLIAKYPCINFIGLTGQMHGILYVDDMGNAISPLYTWQDERGNLKEDKSGHSFVSELQLSVLTQLASGYGLVTHLWNEKQHLIPEDAYKICTIADYVGMRLTKRKTPLLHISNAASLGFFDVKSGTFITEKIIQNGSSENILPDVTKELKSIGLYHGIPVMVAIGDNQASYLGSTNGQSGAVLLNIGTGSQISAVVDSYVELSGIETRPYLNGKYLLVGAALCGGRAYALLEQFLREWAVAAGADNKEQYDVMLQLAWKAYRNRRCKAIKVQTTFQGTRQTPDASGVIWGIRENNFNPGNVILGFIEGIIIELYEMYDRIKTYIEIEKLIGSGNGIRKNPLMQEIAKEQFGMECVLPDSTEEAAYGAAICCQLM